MEWERKSLNPLRQGSLPLTHLPHGSPFPSLFSWHISLLYIIYWPPKVSLPPLDEDLFKPFLMMVFCAAEPATFCPTGSCQNPCSVLL